MATRTPVIIPNHTSLAELGNNGERGYMLTTLYPVVAMVDNIIRFQADLYEIADKLDEVKNHIDTNNRIYTERIEKAYDFVNALNWEGISKNFIKAIRQLLK
jgi:glycosyltransferase involved in cell wall biosynthesis